MTADRSTYTKTYTSFSGCDMVATIDIIVPDQQGNQRKMSRVVGELQTISYSIHMDKAPVRSLGSVNAKDYVYGPRTIAGSLVFAMFDKHIVHEILTVADHGSNLHRQKLVLMDELPPFSITISMANEYGQKARLALYQVRIINEGNVMSVNDVYTENTYQFVATDIEYLTNAMTGGSSGSSNAEILYESANSYAIATGIGARPYPVSSTETNKQELEEAISIYENYPSESMMGSFQMNIKRSD